MISITRKSKQANRNSINIAVVSFAIAFNIISGSIVTLLKLPVYLDALGTVIVTLLLGFRLGALTGVLSFLIGGLLTNPVLPFFAGTQLVIAGYVFLIGRIGGLKNIYFRILSGIGLGVIAGIVSAPVIAYLFGGITGSGPSMIVAYLLASGENLIKSVLYSGIASEPIDKTLQLLISYQMIKALPKSIVARFKNEILIKNNLLVYDESQK